MFCFAVMSFKFLSIGKEIQASLAYKNLIVFYANRTFG
jgi:hypothetical protein